MRHARALILATLLVGAIIPAQAAEYFVSPEGDDDNLGTREAPWRTVAKANAALEAGDTAIFLPGDYDGPLAPANSGAPDAPITYRSEEPLAARLLPGAESHVIRFSERTHITIADFRVDGLNRANWGHASHADHLTISGCKMRNFGGGSFYNFEVRQSDHARIVDNLFDRGNPRPMDMVYVVNSDHLLLEGNSFMHAGHSPLTIEECNYAVMRANVFHNEWGRNHVIWDSGRLLFEGNIITRARDSAGSAGSVSQTSHDDSIVRHNRLFDNLGAPLAMASYIYTAVSPTGRFRGPFVNTNNRFYHNVFADNVGTALNLGTLSVSSNVFQNNIFYRNDWPGGHIQAIRPEGISRDNRFVHNVFRGDEAGQALVGYGSNYWTAEEANRRTHTTGDFWSEFHGNVDEDPGFLDPQNRDYRLAPGSAAIDAGEPLARAVGAGTGRAMPVNDGIPFFDGFGVEGQEGDWIAVGAGDNLAQVLRVELRYYRPAILHLDREVTWTDAMPVSLPWAGEAPDIGAYQRGVTDPTGLIALARPAVVRPGEPVQFSLDTLGKEVESVAWAFAGGAFSHQEEPVHAFAEEGNYAVTVRATFSNGRRGVDALFIRVESPTAPTDPLAWADFEDTTFRDWGYHFKFYRGHQTGAAHVERPDGEGKCMHLFYEAGKANTTAAQIAPGAWDIDRYPFVRFQYRIPPGVPVAVQFNPFFAPDRPTGFHLAGTPDRNLRIAGDPGYTLVNDGQWREITLDVRRLREVYPDLKHLRQFMFNTPWTSVPAPAQWHHFPALQSDYTSHPDGPEDTATYHSVDMVLLRAREAGAWLEMPFTLAGEVTGEVFVDLLDHDARAVVQVLLNGEVRVQEYDHHTEGISRESVSLGEMTLPAGEHRLRVQVTDARVGFVGLVGVTIRPEGAPPALDLGVEDFEFWFDDFAILPDAQD